MEASLSAAVAAAEAGQFDDALRLFTEAPSCATAHEQCAQVLLELGRAAEAVEAARAACQADPRWGAAL